MSVDVLDPWDVAKSQGRDIQSSTDADKAIFLSSEIQRILHVLTVIVAYSWVRRKLDGCGFLC